MGRAGKIGDFSTVFKEALAVPSQNIAFFSSRSWELGSAWVMDGFVQSKWLFIIFPTELHAPGPVREATQRPPAWHDLSVGGTLEPESAPWGPHVLAG